GSHKRLSRSSASSPINLAVLRTPLARSAQLLSDRLEPGSKWYVVRALCPEAIAAVRVLVVDVRLCGGRCRALSDERHHANSEIPAQVNVNAGPLKATRALKCCRELGAARRSGRSNFLDGRAKLLGCGSLRPDGSGPRCVRADPAE